MATIVLYDPQSQVQHEAPHTNDWTNPGEAAEWTNLGEAALVFSRRFDNPEERERERGAKPVRLHGWRGMGHRNIEG